MRVLSLIHRWAGGFIGLLLALIALSGAILVWEGSWVAVPGASDPLLERTEAVAQIVDRAAADGQVSRITFASDETGLHQIINRDGSGAYVRQDGTVTAKWETKWERPELWLFDFHHHLFAGKSGETLTGIAGFAGLLFIASGLVLWWRGRARFRPTLLPKRMTPGAITKHHRDLGLLAAPLLILSMTTGVLMLFEPLRNAAIGREERPKMMISEVPVAEPGEAILHAKYIFPKAALRRITLPSEAGGEIVVRLRQPFEWTPQGRTQLSFAADGRVTVQDASAANRAAWISEKLYPLHSAKIGGVAMKLVMTLSGLALAMLGSLAVYAFWFRQAKRGLRSGPAARRSPKSSRVLDPIA